MIARRPTAPGDGAAAQKASDAVLHDSSGVSAPAVYPRDVFISHAGADKSSHARPLAEALRRFGVSVWLDEGQLSDGDSLSQSVGWGLDRAACTVFLITPRFMERKWPEKELHTALTREINSGATRTIAIIDGPHAPVFERYPLLADKLFIDWDVGVNDIAQRLAARFARRPEAWHIGHHPAEYTGVVWTRLTPSSEQAGEAHRVTMLWGNYRLETTVQPLGTGPVSLMHHKTQAVDLPLYVRVEPAAIVTVGQGPAPDPDQLNVDEGWIRLAGAPIVS